MLKLKNIKIFRLGETRARYSTLIAFIMLKIIAKTIAVLFIIFGMSSCVKQEITPNFEDQDKLTIYDYIQLNKEKYSSFLKILETGKIAKTLSAYNPKGTGYTLFLPDNETIDRFIAEDVRYSSLEDLLADSNYVYILSRYHIVDMSISTNEFPFGALPELTLSGDLLTVSFVIEPDTSYYKINNQAPVVLQNIELSNGYIHIISSTLKPIIYTTYAWLEQHSGFSIFKAAIDATGLKGTFNINTKDLAAEARAFTLLIEPDSVFEKQNINTFDDLANLISPGKTDFTNSSNLLNKFILYHLLVDVKFLDDFVNVSTNYTTFSEIPLNINGAGLDIAINKGKQDFDTIINAGDTTIINFVGFNYDASNVLTQSGVIHFIDQILMQQKPSRALMTFEFWEEPMFNKFRSDDPGTYIVEDSTSLNVVKYSGTDLFFVITGDKTSSAWGGDYVMLNGDFTVSYTVPKLVQGSYTVFLRADAFNSQNAVIEVNIDGKNMGGLIDLATGGSAAWPFTQIELGTIDFVKYEQHTIEAKSLIPGRFLWDYIQFEPK
jgi:uncharacterized surface protein with fasciclin (FAS1) repeats